MSKPLVPDELWALVESLLPVHPYTPGIGKPCVPDRVCLTGIVFVLKIGLPWEDFPQEMGCCGMTLWNRLNEWREAGIGTNSTACYWTSFAAPTKSTSPV